MLPIDERDAKWIRYLRVKQFYSWSRLGEDWRELFGQSFGATDFESGAQLCEWASGLLGEELE
jgi:hypothetical protein